MGEINDLQIAANNNTSLFPNGMLIDQVNEAARELQAMIARDHKDTTAQLATTGTSTSYSVISHRYITAYVAGTTFKLRFHLACGNDPVLSINALGDRALCRQSGASIQAGDIALNQIVEVDYNSALDKFVCLGIGDSSQSEGMPSVTVATLPALTDKRIVLVTNEAGGAVPAFSDGTNWRRVTDRAIVS